MKKFDYTLNFKKIDFRAHPELYCIGKGEQGVLLIEPYKSELLPYWRFKTPEIAQKSAKKIYALFLAYVKKKDFVGMDMARKFLQMGYTRARRYANHPSGKKYSDKNKTGAPSTIIPPDYYSEKNKKHFRVTQTKKVLPIDTDAFTNEKSESAKIFYGYYFKAKNNLVYKKYKKIHQEKYEVFLKNNIKITVCSNKFESTQ